MMRIADVEGMLQRMWDQLEHERSVHREGCDARDRCIADLERAVGDAGTKQEKVRSVSLSVSACWPTHGRA